MEDEKRAGKADAPERQGYLIEDDWALMQEEWESMVSCPECGGSGTYDDVLACEFCNGDGFIEG